MCFKLFCATSFYNFSFCDCLPHHSTKNLTCLCGEIRQNDLSRDPENDLEWKFCPRNKTDSVVFPSKVTKNGHVTEVSRNEVTLHPSFRFVDLFKRVPETIYISIG